MADHVFSYPPTDIGSKRFQSQGQLAAGEALQDKADIAAEMALTAAAGKTINYQVTVTLSERPAP